MRRVIKQVTIFVAFLWVLFLNISCSSGSGAEGDYPDTFADLKWGTPWSEAKELIKKKYTYDTRNSFNERMFTKFYDSGVHEIVIKNYVHEGVEGELVYSFAKQNDQYVFAEGSFKYEGQDDIEGFDNYDKEELKEEFAKNTAYFKKLDELYTSQYGQTEPQEAGLLDEKEKVWLWKDKFEINLFGGTRTVTETEVPQNRPIRLTMKALSYISPK